MPSQPKWWKDAACGEDNSIPTFFPNLKDEKAVRELKKICRTCSVRPECFAYAYVNEEEEGVWGGGLYKERISFISMLNVPIPRSEESLVLALRSVWGMND